MRFSIYMNPQTTGPDQDVEIIEENIRQVSKVIDAGFDGVVLTEHHFSEYNTYGDNILMASHLAGRLRPGVKFLLSAVIPPLHNPMRLAQQLNLLDIVSQGNAIVGFGSGGSPVEFSGLGRKPKDRYEDRDQVLDAMTKVMLKDKADPPLEWKTRYGSGTVYTRIMPSGYNRRVQPFARAVTQDENARKAGEDGMYLFSGRTTLEETARRQDAYREGLESTDLPASEIDDRLNWSFHQKNVVVAPTDEEAREESYRRIAILEEYNGGLQELMSGVEGADALRPVITVGNVSPEAFFNKSFIAGSPETVRAELQRYAEIGIRHMALYFNFGFMPSEISDRSIDLFLDEVLPHLSTGSLAQVD